MGSRLVKLYCLSGSSSTVLWQSQQYTSCSNPNFHARTKHIEVHYHIIWECVLARDVDLQHISMNLQTIDIFTKALGVDKFRQFLSELGLSTSKLPSLGGSKGWKKSDTSGAESGRKLDTSGFESWTSKPKPTPKVDLHQKLSLKGCVENQTQPSLMCEHTP